MDGLRYLRPAFAALLALLVMADCKLSSTRVRFQNGTGAQTVSNLSFGAALFTGNLAPGETTDYYSIQAGTSNFSARLQDGSVTTPLQYTVDQGESYTIVLSDRFGTLIALTGFAAGGTITVGGVPFTAVTGPSSGTQFSIDGSDAQDLAELMTCIVNGVPGITTDGNYLTSTVTPWVVTSTAPAGQFQAFSAYWLMTALNLD